MPPQQPQYGPPPAPSGPEQYDFIMTPQQNNGGKLPSLNVGNNGMIFRVAIVAGGAVVLLIGVIIFISIVTSLSSINTTPLITITQEQSELAHISSSPITDATEQPTQNFAATTEYTMLGEQQAFLNFLKQNGTTVSTQALAATESSQTDTTLTEAQNDGTYDQTYISIATTQLNAYEQTLKQAYASAKTKTERNLINGAYAQAQLLLKQSTQTE